MAIPTAQGSPLLKLIILVLVVVLLLSLYVPSLMWSQQRQRINECRLRMDDVYRASQRYTEVNRSYTPSLEEIINFARQDFMMVGPAKFERERLNLIPGQRDSLLVGYPDSFHVEKITWDSPNEDSLVLTLEPYSRFSSMPASQLAFASDGPVFVFRRDQYQGDNSVIVHTMDSLRTTFLPGDSVRIATVDYLLNQPIDSIELCPTVHRPMDISINVKITMNGVVNALVNPTSPAQISQDTLMQMVVLNKFRGDAIARTQEAINRDTALADTKDSLMFAEARNSLFYGFFDQKILELKPGEKLRLESDKFVTTSSDSIAFWEDTFKIKNALFSLEPDPLLDKLYKRADVQDLFNRMTFEETYWISKTDTVGLTIKCPIKEEDRVKPGGFFDGIFGVKMEANHGSIYNGDLSWSEKR